MAGDELDLPTWVYQHAGYHAGFDDGLQGDPLFDDATDEYRAGWHAAWRARDILAALRARAAQG